MLGSASPPMKRRRVDTSFRKLVLGRDAMEEPAVKRGKRFHKTSPSPLPPTSSDCVRYNAALYEVQSSRALQRSRARIPVRVVFKELRDHDASKRKYAFKDVTYYPPLKPCCIETVEVGEVKEMAASSLPSFTEMAKANT